MRPDADNDRDPIEERLQKVRARWLERAGASATAAISYDAVAEILLLLAEHGVPPTVRAVREVYGSGSPNVINPLVRQAWTSLDMTKRMATRTDGAALPPRLLQFWDLLVSDARKSAEDRFAAQREELEAQRAGLDAQTEVLIQREAQIEERVSGMTAQLSLLEVSVRDLRAALTQKTQDFDAIQKTLVAERQSTEDAQEALREERDAARQDATELRAELRVVTTELGALRQTQPEIARQVEELRAALDSTRSALDDSRERMTQAQVEKAKREMDLADLRQKLAMAQRDSETLPQLRAEGVELRRELEEARRQAHTAASDFTHAQRQIATLTASLEIRSHLEQDLEKAREDLRTLARDKDLLLRNPPVLLTRVEGIEQALHELLKTNATGDTSRDGGADAVR